MVNNNFKYFLYNVCELNHISSLRLTPPPSEVVFLEKLESSFLIIRIIYHMELLCAVVIKKLRAYYGIHLKYLC